MENGSTATSCWRSCELVERREPSAEGCAAGGSPDRGGRGLVGGEPTRGSGGFKLILRGLSR